MPLETNSSTTSALTRNVPVENQKSGARIYALDALRATMMLLGIWFHAMCSYVQIPLGQVWAYKDADTSNVLSVILIVIHVFRMPVFFAIAGFFAALVWAKSTGVEFLRKRFSRIGGPFVVGLLLLTIPVKSGFIYASLQGNPNAAQITMGMIRSGAIFFQDFSTMHLWFLYYLLYFYVAAFVICETTARMLPEGWKNQGKLWFRRTALSVWRPVWFAIPTAVTLLFMRIGLLDTDNGFLVQPRVLVAYGIFFAFGWALYEQRHILQDFRRFAWTQVLLALLLLPLNFSFVVANEKALPAHNPALFAGAAVTGALMVWLFIFGFIGLFIRYFDRPMPRVRYVSDASYWMYLIHLPFMIWIPALLAPVRLPGMIKMLIVVGVSFPILLLSYHLLVRNTMIGQVLNGKRMRRMDS